MYLRVVAPSTILLVALSACSGTEATVSVDDVRQTATAAGATPDACPLDYDVDAALEAAGVEATAVLDAAGASVSEIATPPADPVEAQIDDGLSPIEVAAGADLSCSYEVGDGDLYVELATSINDQFEAVSLFGARLQQADGGLSVEQLSDIVDALGEPGRTESVPNGTATVTTLHTADDAGTAALWVESDTVTDDELRTVAEHLVDDLGQS
ncbi:MAG: hypothetical protein WBP61_01785 [Nocardioides sp.]